MLDSHIRVAIRGDPVVNALPSNVYPTGNRFPNPSSLVRALPHVFGQAQCHFERVRAVVVCGVGEISQLIDEHPRRWRIREKPHPALRQVRPEPANSHQLVRRVVNCRRDRVADALPGKLAGKLATQQFLKLIRLDAERVRPKAAANRHAIRHQLRRRPAGHVGFDVNDAVAIDAQQHVGRVVAAAGVAAFARDRVRRRGS